MYNYLKVLILSLLILLILLIIYMILDVPHSKQTLKIESIQIAPLEIAVDNSVEEPLATLPMDILSKLKISSEASKESLRSVKEKYPNKVISSLKNKVEAQIVKTVVSPKVLMQKKPSKKRIVVKKKVIPKKKIVVKKKVVPKKRIVMKKKVIHKKEPIHRKKTKTLKTKITKQLSPKKEIRTNINTVNDEIPLKFAKKLGVVSVSNKYETNFIVPEKEEFAQEGIVNISNASLETDEMKNLDFVDTLGVVEISQEFETIEANKHLN